MTEVADIRLDSKDRILVAFRYNERSWNDLYRYKANGDIDESFADNGLSRVGTTLAQTGEPWFRRILFDSQDAIYVSGTDIGDDDTLEHTFWKFYP